MFKILILTALLATPVQAQELPVIYDLAINSCKRGLQSSEDMGDFMTRETAYLSKYNQILALHICKAYLRGKIDTLEGAK